MIAVGRLAGPHGVKGHAKFFFYGEDPSLIDQKGPLFDSNGKEYQLKKERMQKNFWLVRIEGYPDRTAIESLPKLELFIPREQFDELEDSDTFYYEDLISLSALTKDSQEIGLIKAVHNFGASDILEIKPTTGKNFMIPFTKDFVPEINEDHIILVNHEVFLEK